MDINCVAVKEIFSNPMSGFRVLSFYPNQRYDNLKLNKYGNFTVSGTNLGYIKLGENIDLTLREDNRSKYEGSYILIGYPAIKAHGKVEVDPKHEFQLLCQLMEVSQARNVNQAYPDFICRVLNGEEATINYKDIYNVGAIRLEQYIDKVKSNYHTILYMPVASEWGIHDYDEVEKLTKQYTTPDEFFQAINENPYFVLENVVGFNFKKTDAIVLSNKPEMIDSLERCVHACLYILQQNEYEGDTRMNANLLNTMVKEIAPECAKHIVEAVKSSNLIHFDEITKDAGIQQTWEAEAFIASEIMRRVHGEKTPLKKTSLSQPIDWHEFTEVDGFECTEEQSKILQLAVDENVMILTGSAGTGKTTSVKALIRMLDTCGQSYTLLAPTGVAAKRLSASTNRNASTIHRFLARLQGGEGHSGANFVILDEFSMVGVELLSKLLSNIQSSKIVFVCDNAQLASISCGNVLQDILDSGFVPTASLSKVFRYGIGGISTIATDTREGKLGPRNNNGNYNDYTFVPTPSDPMETILELYEQLLNEGYDKSDILVLCPFNKTKVGTYAINNAIQKRFNNHVDTSAVIKVDGTSIMFKVGDKVINTRNNYHATALDYDEEGALVSVGRETAIMNGDIGIVRDIRQDEIGMHLIIEFDGEYVDYSNGNISDLLLGYCISIHKSQGSQAKAVICVTHKTHKRMLTANLLYVGVSRAQDKLIEIGEVEAIEEGLTRQENKERDTWLREMLEAYENNNNEEE